MIILRSWPSKTIRKSSRKWTAKSIKKEKSSRREKKGSILTFRARIKTCLKSLLVVQGDSHQTSREVQEGNGEIQVKAMREVLIIESQSILLPKGWSHRKRSQKMFNQDILIHLILLLNKVLQLIRQILLLLQTLSDQTAKSLEINLPSISQGKFRSKIEQDRLEKNGVSDLRPNNASKLKWMISIAKKRARSLSK